MFEVSLRAFFCLFSRRTSGFSGSHANAESEARHAQPLRADRVSHSKAAAMFASSMTGTQLSTQQAARVQRSRVAQSAVATAVRPVRRARSPERQA